MFMMVKKKRIMGYFSLSSVPIFDHKYEFKFEKLNNDSEVTCLLSSDVLLVFSFGVRKYKADVI